MLHIPPTNLLLLIAEQEPYKRKTVHQTASGYHVKNLEEIQHNRTIRFCDIKKKKGGGRRRERFSFAAFNY